MRFSAVWCCVVLFCGSLARAESLEEVLKQPVIPAGQTLQETIRYCASRVAPLPQSTDAAEWEGHARRIRQQVLDEVVLRGAAREWLRADLGVEWLEIIEGGPGYRIQKLRYEALPGLWIPALLYTPDTLAAKTPVFLNVNGHDAMGKAAPYKQMRCINMAKRGILALNVEWLGMGQLAGGDYSHGRMNQLDLCGTSGLAPFYLVMKRGLDVLLALEHADTTRVGVAGLSGGGWQTIVISSLDERVTLCNPVAGYSSFITRGEFFSDLGDSEQTPVDLAKHADYSHLTCLLAPRPALLTYNEKDNCCFASGHALPPLLDAARPVYSLLKAEQKLASHVNSDPGNHNFEKDNRQALYRFLKANWYAGADFDAEEIPSEDELKSLDQLNVALPAKNQDFHTLAVALSQNLPRKPDIPEGDERAAWQTRRREELRELVRWPSLGVTKVVESEKTGSEVRVQRFQIKSGDDWTVPALVLSRGEQPARTTLVLSDRKRAELAATLEPLLARGDRVICVDPWYLGDAALGNRDYLFALLMSCVGDRPLGTQAAQMAAAATWARDTFGQPVNVLASGPRSSLIALVTVACAPEPFGTLTMNSPYGSLKEILAQNLAVNQAPELFCFGLLEAFDIPQLAALCAPHPLEATDLSEAAKPVWDRIVGAK